MNDTPKTTLQEIPPGMLGHLVDHYRERDGKITAQFSLLDGVASTAQQSQLAGKLRPYFGPHGVKVNASDGVHVPVQFTGDAAKIFKAAMGR